MKLKPLQKLLRLFVCLLTFALKNYAASSELPSVVKQWTTEDGLPLNLVQCIAQTPDGYVWIGTRAGLARFDGMQFRVFTRANTPGLKHDNCLSMAVDRFGALWIGTLDGLVRYKDQQFQTFGKESGLPSAYVNQVYPSRTGGIWVATRLGPCFFKNGIATPIGAPSPRTE